MLHQDFNSTPYQWDRGILQVDVTEKQDRLALLCHDWRLSEPHYKYTRRSSAQGLVVGLHSSVIVGEVEYSSALATGDWHPGWGSQNDAREAVAGEVLRVLGLDDEEEDDQTRHQK